MGDMSLTTLITIQSQRTLITAMGNFSQIFFGGGRVPLRVIGLQSKKFRSSVIGDTKDYPWEKFERTCSVNIATLCLHVTQNVRKRRYGGYRPLGAKFQFFLCTVLMSLDQGDRSGDTLRFIT
jgi:hypothetical protein